MFSYNALMYSKRIGALIVDFNQSRPATATASYNLVRCSLAAAGAAWLEPLITATNVGWCFSVYALMCAITIPVWMVLWWVAPRRKKVIVEEEDTDAEEAEQFL